MEYDYRISKFKNLIGKISNNSDCYGVGARESIGVCLELIYDNFENMNKYANAIYEYFPRGMSYYLVQKSITIMNIQDRIEATNKFVAKNKNNCNTVRVLFWALIVLAVDDTDKEKHLSLICDFARMLDVTDDEMKDLVNVIKRIFKCGAYEPIKTQRVRDMFNERFWDKF